MQLHKASALCSWVTPAAPVGFVHGLGKFSNLLLLDIMASRMADINPDTRFTNRCDLPEVTPCACRYVGHKPIAKSFEGVWVES